MPLLEIVHSTQVPPTETQKQALAREVIDIFHEVLGTPDGRLRVCYYPVAWQDTLPGLLEDKSDEQPTGGI